MIKSTAHMTSLGKIVFGALFLLFIGVVAGGIYHIRLSNAEDFKIANSIKDFETKEKPDRKVETTIQSGDTFVLALKEVGVATTTAQEIVNETQEVYDLASIRAGNIVTAYYDSKTYDLKKIIYEIDSNSEFIISTSTSSTWDAEVKEIEYNIKTERVEGTITNSFYNAAKEKGADDAIIIEFATVYQWTIDFALDTRVGDKFNFIYEKRFRDGEYIDTGRVLTGEYIQDDKIFEAFFFEESEDERGYFDAEGNSLRREFLKAPVAFKYITSGFTTGSRHIREFNISTGHRAIDYAAPYGTPVRAVGDGTVISAGWNGSFGNFTSVHHNDTYTTNYAHQSRIIVRRGQKVKQGEVIGYVGSTGLSTGPHLHYEMVKYGAKINPLREEFPPGEAVKEENKELYKEAVEVYRGQL